MFLNLYRGGFTTDNLVQVMLSAVVIIISLTLHELAHGYAAYKCGDSTARNFGRLTLNPLKHLDPIGTLMMFFIGFGYAKPVPINPRNFRKPRRDMLIVASAGVIVNFLLAFVSIILYYAFALANFLPLNIQQVILQLLSTSVGLNIGLAVFNLIPLPPLDGSRIVSTMLTPIAAAKYTRIEYYSRYIFLGIILLSWVPYPLSIINDIVWFPVDWVRTVFFNLFNFVARAIFGLL